MCKNKDKDSNRRGLFDDFRALKTRKSKKKVK